MSRFIRRMRNSVVLTTVLCFLQVYPPSLFAESPVKLQKFEGRIDTTSRGPVVPFALQGEASHLGNFSSVGEVVFSPGQTPGTLIGNGVVVLQAANGDQLVGVVTWDVGAIENNNRPASIHFSWRDSIRMSDGTLVVNTGRFVDDRPQGLVVIAIIAILIHTMIPAVQKVKK